MSDGSCAASVSVVPGLLVHASVRAVARREPLASLAVGVGINCLAIVDKLGAPFVAYSVTPSRVPLFRVP
jgi:hypothetical protein